MNGHRTDKQLIDSLFGLAPESEAAETRLHPDACPECRIRQDALKARLAPLDLLRGEVAATEALVQATLSRVRTPGEKKRAPAVTPRVWWWSPAAA